MLGTTKTGEIERFAMQRAELIRVIGNDENQTKLAGFQNEKKGSELVLVFSIAS